MTNDTRRPDPLEELARQICAERGFDPDCRIAMPPPAKAGRTAPAWTFFRGDAREKRQVIEIAALTAARGTAAPQPERFQNAPLTIFGEHEANTIMQMKTCLGVGNVVAGVICADGHLGYAQPVGAAIAYEGQISVSGVGYDIGCGNLAVKLDTTYGQVKDRLPEIMREIRQHVSFGIGRVNEERVDHDLFDDEEAWKASGMMDYRQKARTQLGTVGSGNHYIDIFAEWGDGWLMESPIWIGVHFGSRGLGHTTATRAIKAAGGKDGINVDPVVLDERSEQGQRYLWGMALAGQYAYAGREWVVDRVRKIIGGVVLDSVHNHHNFAWQEMHGDKMLWVVRKGCTPAFPGQRGFIGGSMGDDAVIVEGVESASSQAALYSTVHGAGRMFGRKEAIRRFTRFEMGAWLTRRKVLVSGGDLDESPMAYRRLDDVLTHHRETIAVTNTLRPIAVMMAGGEADPFKD